MTTTTNYPITVDGVRLDSLAYNVTGAKWTVPGVRSADQVIPGQHGVAAGLDEDYEPGGYTLDMFVRGTDVDGVPQPDSVGTLRNNLDTLLHLFSKRYALLDVRETVNGSGDQRQALCKVQDSLVPDVQPGQVALFTVSLIIPGAFWQDVAASTVNVGAITSGTTYDLAALQGATAPIQDGIYCLTGPATNPSLIDPATGRSVTLNQALAAGQVWRVNAATWSSRTGAGLTAASADTAGTDQIASTVWSDARRPFTLRPVLSGGLRKVQVKVGGTAYTAGTTALSVTARRKFR